MKARHLRTLLDAPAHPLPAPPPPMRNALVVIAIAVLAGLAFLFLQDDGATRTATDPERTADAVSSPSDERSMAGASVAPNQGREALAEPDDTNTPSEPQATYTGRVLFPQGTPADETCTVRVTWAGRDWARALDRQEEGAPEDDAEPRNPVYTDERLEVPVDADGRFTFAVPTDVDLVLLEASGNYLFMDEPVRRRTDAPIELSPRLGAWLTVDVTFDAGAPGFDEGDVADFEIQTAVDFSAPLRPSNLPPIVTDPRRAQAELTAPGTARFELRALPCDHLFGVRIDPEPFAVEMVGDLGLAPGHHTTRAVALASGATLEGLVVDGQGRAVEGAALRIEPASQFDFAGRNRFRIARTDADGAFTASGLVPGALKVSVTADDALPFDEQLTLAAGELRAGHTITLDMGATLTGTAFVAGAPRAGIAVTLHDDLSASTPNLAGGFQPTRRSAETDAEGGFELHGLGAGPYVLEARFGEEPWNYARLAGVRPEAGAVTLDLVPTPVLHGRVVDAAGAPVELFNVAIGPNNLAGLMNGLDEERTFQDPEGRWALPEIGDGQWLLFVNAPEYARSEGLSVTRPDDTGEALVVTLQRGGTVAGVVRDESGRPVPGASVIHDVETGDMLLDMFGVGPSDEVRTEADGRFALEHVGPGPLTIYARKAGFTDSEPFAFELEEGALRGDVELVISSGGAISGLILDDDRNPVAGMLVQIQELDMANQTFLHSKADGSFFVDKLAPGTWQVIGVPDTYETGQTGAAALEGLKIKAVEVVAGEVVEVTLGAPAENPVHVVGRIRPADGLENALVMLFPEGQNALGSMIIAPVTDDGHFEADLLFPGRYVLAVNRGEGVGQDSVEFVREIPDQDTVELTLEMPGGAIHGRVTDDAGKPLSGIRVSLYADGGLSTGTIGGGKYAETTTDAAGEYAVQWLAAGSYTVGAGGKPLVNLIDGASPYGREVRHGIALADGEVEYGVDFELASAGTISGRVLDANGMGVPNASVFVRNESGQLLERISLATSGADGNFTYGGVAAGRYTVTARAEDTATETKATVDVQPAKTAKVQLELAPGTILEVTVVDAEYDPLMAELVVLDPDGHDVSNQFGLSDIQKMMSQEFSVTVRRFGPLPPGRYTVIGRANGIEEKKPVTLSGQAERKLKLRIK